MKNNTKPKTFHVKGETFRGQHPIMGYTEALIQALNCEEAKNEFTKNISVPVELKSGLICEEVKYQYYCKPYKVVCEDQDYFEYMFSIVFAKSPGEALEKFLTNQGLSEVCKAAFSTHEIPENFGFIEGSDVVIH